MIRGLEQEKSIIDFGEIFIKEIIEEVDSISFSGIDFSREELKSGIEAKIKEFDLKGVSTLTILYLRSDENSLSDEIEEKSTYGLIGFLKENESRDFLEEFNDIVESITDIDTYIKIKIKENFIRMTSIKNDIEEYYSSILEIFKYSFIGTLKKES